MKNLHPKTVLISLVLLTGTACSKSEVSTTEVMHETDSAVLISDSISNAATMEMEGKRFIKSANVDMEVKDVYDATIAIEKSVQEMGGFVTTSELISGIVSEETYEVSDESAVLLRKFRTENNMQVRIPTEQLGALLQFINNRKVFLTSRVILAEDVTANIELAKMESKRIKTTADNIRQIRNDKDKVKLDDQNMGANNNQKVADLQMSDRLKYSTVQIYLKEPELRVAEIAVANVRNKDNKFKSNFLYETKNGFVEGFYLTQRLVIGLLTLWPILIIGGLLIYLFRRKRTGNRIDTGLPRK
ncbi:DUF4349 domain-containing protein [Kaistella sp. PBT33-4]|uniref:DUF4349 domain-containing protein n=1 Tax=Kaistella sp. PBT33-4 TaxID=3032000 RepID=UPI0023D7C4B0|nr:DUF4349 domain-containing protein [Kaistella sp. PBT33-4]MDF0719329.1 DUF4349 domain-containing protein [Kaistella sp. PBT33-4]